MSRALVVTIIRSTGSSLDARVLVSEEPMPEPLFLQLRRGGLHVTSYPLTERVTSAERFAEIAGGLLQRSLFG